MAKNRNSHSLIFSFVQNTIPLIKGELKKNINPDKKCEYYTAVLVWCNVWFDKDIYFCQFYAMNSGMVFSEKQLISNSDT